MALGRGVFHRIEHQVGERAAQLGLAALELNRGVGFQGDLLVALPGQRQGVALDRLQQAVDRHWLVVRGIVGGLELGQ
ncbi:hypothetical protein D3C81_2138030 [compost metagenome]